MVTHTHLAGHHLTMRGWGLGVGGRLWRRMRRRWRPHGRVLQQSSQSFNSEHTHTHAHTHKHTHTHTHTHKHTNTRSHTLCFWHEFHCLAGLLQHRPLYRKLTNMHYLATNILNGVHRYQHTIYRCVKTLQQTQTC